MQGRLGGEGWGGERTRGASAPSAGERVLVGHVGAAGRRLGAALGLPSGAFLQRAPGQLRAEVHRLLGPEGGSQKGFWCNNSAFTPGFVAPLISPSWGQGRGDRSWGLPSRPAPPWSPLREGLPGSVASSSLAWEVCFPDCSQHRPKGFQILVRRPAGAAKVGSGC